AKSDILMGGRRVPGKSGRFGDVFNPNTGEVQARVAFASRTEVREAAKAAKEAQRQWAAKNPQVRARVLMRFLEIMAKEKDELARMLSMEHGKTIPDSLGDIQRGLEVVEFEIGRA